MVPKKPMEAANRGGLGGCRTRRTLAGIRALA